MSESQSNQHALQKEAFYQRLRDELAKTNEWPSRYMYKFIIPNDEKKAEQVKAKFKGQEIDYKENYSRTGKYISISIVTEEKSPESIINRYKSMEDIEGLISL